MVIPSEKLQLELRIKELERDLQNVKGTPCEVYTRIVGYFRPVKEWNPGKQEEYGERIVYEKGIKETVPETCKYRWWIDW